MNKFVSVMYRKEIKVQLIVLVCLFVGLVSVASHVEPAQAQSSTVPPVRSTYQGVDVYNGFYESTESQVLREVEGEIVPGQYVVVLKETPNIAVSSNRSAGNSKNGVTNAEQRHQEIERVRTHVEEVLSDHNLLTLNDDTSRSSSKNSENEALYIYDAVLAGFSAKLDETRLLELAEDPRVEYIVPEMLGTVDNWGLDRIDQPNLPLNGSYVSYPNNGEGVNVYIIDSGIRATHQEFGGRVVGGVDLVNIDGWNNDCYGHGTHVAGIVGGRTYGVAKSVNLYSVRVMGCSNSVSLATMTAGLNWVAQNANGPSVVNMSLSSGPYDPVDTAVRNLVAAGTPITVSSSNSDQDACGRSPAREPAAITVNATTRSDSRVSFSNWGSCTDIFAPGEDILSASHDSDTQTVAFSGTSMATPQVAGAAALYLSAYPNASPAQVENAIKATAIRNVVGDAKGSPNLLLYVTNLLSVGPPAPARCQEISNTRGTHHNVTWGSATPEEQAWWNANGCNTQPNQPNLSCQQISDTRGTHHGVTWGDATPEEREWWIANGCNTQPSQSTPPPSSSTQYALQNQSSGKCVDGSGDTNGANVLQWDCHGGGNQQFEAVQGNGGFMLKLQHSGKCLDVAGGNILQWDCHGGDNQIFNWDGAQLRVKNSNQCVTISGGSSNNSANVEVSNCINSSAQQFRQADLDSHSASIDAKVTADSAELIPTNVMLNNSETATPLTSIILLSALLGLGIASSRLNE